LTDAGEGKVDIFVSTISLAEIGPSKMGKSGLRPIEVLNSISKAIVLVDPTPDIMSVAGHLRDQTYRLIGEPETTAPKRNLSLGDSIHIATAIALREEFGVQNLVLHTFDEGKSKDSEIGKKTVPIIGFQNWCRDCGNDEEVMKAIEIKRGKPEHPSCPLPRPKSSHADSQKPPGN
jgi:hypothetical protein